ncbi:unnamed protein product [Closterium sp. NIES-54]
MQRLRLGRPLERHVSGRHSPRSEFLVVEELVAELARMESLDWSSPFVESSDKTSLGTSGSVYTTSADTSRKITSKSGRSSSSGGKVEVGDYAEVTGVEIGRFLGGMRGWPVGTWQHLLLLLFPPDPNLLFSQPAGTQATPARQQLQQRKEERQQQQNQYRSQAFLWDPPPEPPPPNLLLVTRGSAAVGRQLRLVQRGLTASVVAAVVVGLKEKGALKVAYMVLLWWCCCWQRWWWQEQEKTHLLLKQQQQQQQHQHHQQQQQSFSSSSFASPSLPVVPFPRISPSTPHLLLLLMLLAPCCTPRALSAACLLLQQAGETSSSGSMAPSEPAGPGAAASAAVAAVAEVARVVAERGGLADAVAWVVGANTSGLIAREGVASALVGVAQVTSLQGREGVVRVLLEGLGGLGVRGLDRSPREGCEEGSGRDGVVRGGGGRDERARESEEGKEERELVEEIRSLISLIPTSTTSFPSFSLHVSDYIRLIHACAFPGLLPNLKVLARGIAELSTSHLPGKSSRSESPSALPHWSSSRASLPGSVPGLSGSGSWRAAVIHAYLRVGAVDDAAAAARAAIEAMSGRRFESPHMPLQESGSGVREEEQEQDEEWDKQSKGWRQGKGRGGERVVAAGEAWQRQGRWQRSSGGGRGSSKREGRDPAAVGEDVGMGGIGTTRRMVTMGPMGDVGGCVAGRYGREEVWEGVGGVVEGGGAREGGEACWEPACVQAVLEAFREVRG